jgi:hypothetical protein
MKLRARDPEVASLRADRAEAENARILAAVARLADENKALRLQTESDAWSAREHAAALQAENARLRDALAPFAAVGQGYIEVGELVGDDCPTALGGIKVGHLRAAAKALGRP